MVVALGCCQSSREIWNLMFVVLLHVGGTLYKHMGGLVVCRKGEK